MLPVVSRPVEEGGVAVAEGNVDEAEDAGGALGILVY